MDINIGDVFCSKRNGRKWEVDSFNAGKVGLLADDDRGWQSDLRWVNPKYIHKYYTLIHKAKESEAKYEN